MTMRKKEKKVGIIVIKKVNKKDGKFPLRVAKYDQDLKEVRLLVRNFLGKAKEFWRHGLFSLITHLHKRMCNFMFVLQDFICIGGADENCIKK